MSRSNEDTSFKEIMDEMGAAAKRLADALIDMMKTLMEHQEKQRSEQLKTLMKMLKSAGYEQSPENAQKLQAHLDKIAENKTKLAKVEKETADLAGKKSLTPDEVQKVKDLEVQRAELLKEQEQLLAPDGGPDLAIDEVALQLKNKSAQAQQAPEQAPAAGEIPAAVEQPKPKVDLELEGNDLKADVPEKGPAAEVAASVKQQPGKAQGDKKTLGSKIEGLGKKLDQQAGQLDKDKAFSADGPKSGLANILNRVNKAGSVGETLAEQARKALKGGFKQVAKLAQHAGKAIK